MYLCTKLNVFCVGIFGEAPPYKPEDYRFDSPMWPWNFFRCLDPSGCTMALGSTQPLTEMSTRDISFGGGVKAVVCWADNLATFVSGLS
jgi:hypothetical protein